MACDPILKLDLCVYRRDTFEHQLLWLDANGAPVDLNGYTAKMEVRKTESSTTVIMTATDGDGITLGGVAGTVDILLTPAKTDIATTEQVYDLQVINTGGDGKVTTLVRGLFPVVQDVTA